MAQRAPPAAGRGAVHDHDRVGGPEGPAGVGERGGRAGVRGGGAGGVPGGGVGGREYVPGELAGGGDEGSG